MNANLTKSKIDSLIPSLKDQFVWDLTLPGFGLKITPNGRKVFILQYRVGGREARTRRYTLGRYGDLTPDQARREAIRLRGLIATGNDPAEAKTTERAAILFKVFALQYLEQHAIQHKKPSSVAEDKRNIENHLLPALGNISLTKISRADVAKLHHNLRASPVAANRTLSLLNAMLNLAERWGLRLDGSNPCRHIKRFKEHRRERFLNGEELARLGQALAMAERGNTHSPFVIGLFRLLILTGARLGEIRLLRWSDVNLEEFRLNLADSKTGQKTIYLNAPAIAVLNQLPRIEGNPFVCPGQRKDKGLISVHRAWFDIRGAARLPDIHIHDLRHSFASVAAGSGMSLPIIGALLGHSQAETTQRYSHLDQNPLRVASESIAQKISEAMNPKKRKIPVAPFSKGSRGTKRR